MGCCKSGEGYIISSAMIYLHLSCFKSLWKAKVNHETYCICSKNRKLHTC